MKKVILIPIVVAAVFALIPGAYFGGLVPLDSHVEAFSPTLDREELVKHSEVVLKGTLGESRTVVDWEELGTGIIVPNIYTVWVIDVEDSLKKDTEIAKTSFEFIVDGGTYNNMVQDVMHETELNEGDNVIVFLSIDRDSVYGDNYYMTGIESGIYKIENGIATNSYLGQSYETAAFETAIKEQG
jgi:hypothetical protein